MLVQNGKVKGQREGAEDEEVLMILDFAVTTDLAVILDNSVASFWREYNTSSIDEILFEAIISFIQK
jgi:hypothetical protein